jgi:hypothetical protein
MEIRDFNQPENAPAPTAATGEPESNNASFTRRDTEITLLKKRIEHLELVVETARSLMTSNQERLLRRLHDVPQEMLALTATLNRLDQGDAAIEPAPARRVA